ncbi:M20/M25/M40 family metallo-hydrolase [Pelagerythrobacter marensis]|uniref:Leucine aminopeptidase-related protein n=1 Tax=Pelagerythrobacter marensis TaxID=543877 RepID=A0A0G3X608_9SPHN|nr:M20/M25/M40 family metallo-hydrolase [Pelagerythrobacter marensis]AKM06995.1 Leucine aminopeptidase-related protein [Pelagerythrobacter marensis]
MRKLVPFVALLLAAPLSAQDHPADSVSEERLRSDVEKLVSFGTRHTMSAQDDPERGIGAAVDWGLAEFERISARCGGCLTVVAPERMVEGNRIPRPTRLRNAVAIQRGTERPDEVVIVQGHIDSRVSDVMDFTSDAPGANDDASGTALVIEAARVLSQRQYPTTIVYALLSGEEQGLYGGRLLADYAKEQGWTVKAVLNNDIVGGTCGSDGYCDDGHVRVFSEGPRADLTASIRADQRRNGGENDSPARNLSRWLDTLAEQTPEGLDVRQIWRTDRMGRGGDQIPFLEQGYPAIRFSVAVEDYDHQHQDLRTEDGVVYGDTVDEMNFPYLAKVTRLNVRALDKLAHAPLPPAPSAEAAVQTFTALSWDEVPGATGYTIWHRRTDEPYWRDEPLIANVVATSARLEGVRGDDWIFGVSARAADGSMSPVASAVPAGAFAPIPAAEDDSD